MTKYSIVTIAAAAFLALAVAPVRAGGVPVTTTVAWTDPGGGRGSVDFQGTVENDVLRGILGIGQQEVAVRGTVGADGRVSGTCHGQDGKQLGSFSGTLDANDQLQGEYTPSGGRASHWQAAADALPHGKRVRLGR